MTFLEQYCSRNTSEMRREHIKAFISVHLVLLVDGSDDRLLCVLVGFGNVVCKVDSRRVGGNRQPLDR